VEKKFKYCYKLSGKPIYPRPSVEIIDLIHQIQRSLYLYLNDHQYKVWQNVPIIKENTSEIVPDLVVFEYKSSNYFEFDTFPKIVIEIADNEEESKSLEKAIDIMKKRLEIKEIFIYNYQTNDWKKVSQDKVSNSSFSNFLQKNLPVIKACF
jgi:Uma2 family endonuclease